MKEVNKNMRHVERSLVPLKWAASLSLALLIGGAAHAQTQFASFTQADPNYNLPFRMYNDGTSSSRFGLIDASGNELTTTVNSVNYTGVLVNFQYQIVNGYGSSVGANVQAIMRMTANVNGNVIDLDGGTVLPGDSLRQGLRDIQISFTAITPVNGKTNLLSIGSYVPGSTDEPINGFAPGNGNNNTNSTNGSTARLNGSAGSSTAAVEATESAGNFAFVGYASDFLDFTTLDYTNRNYSISLANVQPTFNVGPNGSGANSAAYLQNFVSSAGGTFGSNPLPFQLPEPGTIGLMFMGMIAGTGVVLRKRR